MVAGDTGRKGRLVPGRGLELEEFPKEIQLVRKSLERFAR